MECEVEQNIWAAPAAKKNPHQPTPSLLSPSSPDKTKRPASSNTGATHQRRMHGFRKPLGLPRHLVLFIPRKRRKLIILGPNQNRDGRLPTFPSYMV